MDASILYQHIKANQRVCRLTTKKDEIYTRCPYCGDSQKDMNSGHLYIQYRPPFKFFCQRCQTSGYTGPELLKLLGVTSYEVTHMVNNALMEHKKGLTVKYGAELNYFNNKRVNLYPNQYTDLEGIKVDYLAKRLDIVIEERDIETYKLILNVKDFCENNNIDLSKRIKSVKDRENFKKVQNHSIGFLTTDKNTIICRSLDPEKTGWRYHNFYLFPDATESKKFYTIKKKLDLSQPEHKIIMTEGILDIIGVYNHVFDRDDEPLYTASNGKSFLFLLNYLASLSLLNVNIEVYSDKDVGIKFFEYVIRNSRLAKFNGLNIVYNQIGKDFGVTKSEIIPTKGITVI
jgi:hypothetical protein